MRATYILKYFLLIISREILKIVSVIKYHFKREKNENPDSNICLKPNIIYYRPYTNILYDGDGL